MVSILQALFPFEQHSPWTDLPSWRLYPAPSGVCHLRSTCPALCFLHCCSGVPHPAYHWILQDSSDYLWQHSIFLQIGFWAFWLSIPLFGHFHIFLRLLNRYLWVLDSLPHHSGFCISTIFDPFLVLIIAWTVYISIFFHRMLLFRYFTCTIPLGLEPCLLQSPLWTLVTWWRCAMECVADLPDSPTGCGKRIFLRPLIVVLSADIVNWGDIGYCNIWATLTKAVSFMSRFVCLINLNKTKPAFSPSLHWVY